jgi:hypothetical protein
MAVKVTVSRDLSSGEPVKVEVHPRGAEVLPRDTGQLVIYDGHPRNNKIVATYAAGAWLTAVLEAE